MLQSDRGAVAPVEEFVFDGSEACPVVARLGPKEPTAIEIEQHNACHEPFREWCRACVVGRGHQDPHHTRDEEKSLPVIGLYGFLRQRPTGSGEDENEPNDDSDLTADTKISNPVLCGRCSADRWIFAHFIENLAFNSYTTILFL